MLFPFGNTTHVLLCYRHALSRFFMLAKRSFRCTAHYTRMTYRMSQCSFQYLNSMTLAFSLFLTILTSLSFISVIPTCYFLLVTRRIYYCVIDMPYPDFSCWPNAYFDAQRIIHVWHIECHNIHFNTSIPWLLYFHCPWRLSHLHRFSAMKNPFPDFMQQRIFFPPFLFLSLLHSFSSSCAFPVHWKLRNTHVSIS